MKRIILLISMLLLGFCWAKPVSASVVDSGTCGENATWELDDEGTLTISGTGDMNDYTDSTAAGTNPPPWHTHDKEIKRLVIEEGIISIGTWAFTRTNITEATIPSSLKKINSNSFAYTSLKSIIIPETVLSIGNGVFSYSGLSNITLPDNLTTIPESLFAHCTSLKTITLPNSIKNIEAYAFTSSGLTDITIPNGVESIEDGLFWNCNSLEKVHLPSSITSIKQFAFAFCRKLTDITIPENVTLIGDSAFKYCTSLKKNLILKSVKKIDSSAFLCCDNLSEITIYPDDVTMYGCSIGSISHGSGSRVNKNFIIHANPNSSAHTYAKEEGIQFSCINHTPVVMPGKEATAESTGLTEGLKCSGCGKIFKEQKVIPKIEIEVKEKHDATYFATNKPAVLTTRIKNSTIQRVSWRSSNKKWATVQGKGPNNSTCVVKPKKAGIGHTVTITATVYYYVNDSSSGSVKVMSLSSSSKKVRKTTLKYKGKITKKITLKSISGTGKVYVGKSIKLKANPRKARKMVEWESSNTSVATVSNGKVRGRKEGTVTITCITKDTNHSKRTKRIKVVKKKKSKK